MFRFQAPSSDLTAGVRALDRAVQASCGRERHPFVTLRPVEDGIACSFNGEPFVVRARLPAEVGGLGAVSVPSRLLASVLRSIDGETTTVRCSDDELRIESDRTRFVINGDPVPDTVDTRQPPAHACTVSSREYLYAFKRVATATLGGQSGHRDDPVILEQRDSTLDLRFDTFDVSATDSVSVDDGVLGAPVAVPSRSFQLGVGQLSPRYRQLRVGTDDTELLWLSTAHELHRFELALGIPAWSRPLRDPEQLQPQSPTRRGYIPGRVLRRALRRVEIGVSGVSTCNFITLRFDAGRQTVRLLAHGWFAAAAEEVPCIFEGDDVEVTLRFADFWYAIRHIRRQVLFLIDDPSKPIEIADGESYRCILRPLPAATTTEPQHAGIAQNVPFPPIPL